jgi:hypothetical protein
MSNLKTHFFIHIPKNGGTAIRLNNDLSKKVQDATSYYHGSAAYTKELHAFMKSVGDHHGDEHARLLDIDESKILGLKKFAILRNPWDRVVSRYFFAKQLIETEKKVPASYADVSSFEAFLEERFKWGHLPYMWHRAVRGWYPAYDYVVNRSGNIACDLLRFERYDQDVSNYFGVDLHIPKRNVTRDKPDYRTVYTPEAIQIVADWYKIDIDTFGFDFDTSATKNLWWQS